MGAFQVFFAEHSEAAWGTIAIMALLIVWLSKALYQGKTSSIKARFSIVDGKIDGLECNQKTFSGDLRGLGRRTSDVERRLSVLEDRTARLEPLIQRLDESIQTHADLAHNLRVELAKLAGIVEGYERRQNETTVRLNSLTDEMRGR